MAHMCGGTSIPTEATKDTQTICDKIKDDLEKKVGRKFDEYAAMQESSQLVAGVNHFVKIHVGGNSYIHVRIFEPLPHTNEPVSLHSYQDNKKLDDSLEYF